MTKAEVLLLEGKHIPIKPLRDPPYAQAHLLFLQMETEQERRGSELQARRGG